MASYQYIYEGALGAPNMQRFVSNYDYMTPNGFVKYVDTFGRLNGVNLGALPVQMRHEEVPYRSAPVYLRLVNSDKRAKDYAAAGFHISATRGNHGGCKDAYDAISGTAPSACLNALERVEVQTAWFNAAEAYKSVFNSATGVPLASQIEGLRAANALADRAYALEGVEPPRDPVTQAPDIAKAHKSSFWKKAGIGAAVAAGIAGLWYFATDDGSGKKKSKKKSRKSSRGKR